MMKEEEIQVNVFFLWVDRLGAREWTCPCVVSEVNKPYFGFLSLDYFKKSKLLLSDKASLRKMRKCSFEEVKRLLRTGERIREDRVTDIKSKLEDAERELKNYRQKTEEFISKYGGQCN